jgi:hypothetical protein
MAFENAMGPFLLTIHSLKKVYPRKNLKTPKIVANMSELLNGILHACSYSES